MKQNQTENNVLYNSQQMQDTIAQLAEQLLTDYQDEIKKQQLAFVGVYTRGVTLAQKISQFIEQKSWQKLDLGTLGITLYRDDVNHRSSPQMIKPTDIHFSIDDRPIILVDDVIFTGRTTRAALNEIMDFGRPSLCRLLVLVERSGRQLPIQADYAGWHVQANTEEKVLVRFAENDPEMGDRIMVISK